MTIPELIQTLSRLVSAGYPALIVGPPGVGKTDAVATVAELSSADLIVSHPVVSDPTDYKGLPGIVDGAAEFLPYGDLRRLISAERPTIAFLDDLGQAPATVQAACMQLLLARRVNGHEVSPHVTFLAASNRRQDRAGVTVGRYHANRGFEHKPAQDPDRALLTRGLVAALVCLQRLAPMDRATEIV